MNVNDISTQLLYSTVPLVCNTPEGTSTGTGFFFSYTLDKNKQVPFLVTNYHVVKNANSGSFFISLATKGEPDGRTIEVRFDGSFAQETKLGSYDLSAIPIAPVLNNLEASGNTPFYRTIEQNLIPDEATINALTALEDITFIGYPSGIYDSANKTPLIRKGITSTPIWNNYQGEQAFLIDASVFPGSSGSPAFIFNQGSYSTGDGIAIGSRLLFVGIVAGTIMRHGKEYLDLGKVIKSSVLLNELEKLVPQLLEQANSR